MGFQYTLRYKCNKCKNEWEHKRGQDVRCPKCKEGSDVQTVGMTRNK